MQTGARTRIIGPEMLPGTDGANINGPACIAVPPWVEQPLGRYYLYFAHHAGTCIRLAWADTPRGPWTIHPGGVLPIAGLAHCRDHLASPDVVVDEASRTIRLFFHAVEPHGTRQLTYLATSADGLAFSAHPEPLAEFYLRVVPWRGRWLGMSKGGVLWLSDSGTGGFKRLPRPAFPMRDPEGNAPGDVRHVALSVEGDDLWILFSRIGDAPEHIRLGLVDLRRPPELWRVEREAPLLAPLEQWEGADLPIAPSRAGASPGVEHALRDPAVLRDGERAWLFYSAAGEQAIGVTPLPDLRKHHDRAAVPAGAESLAEALARLDGTNPRQRVFVMGCGRSGTWLLTALMASFADVAVVGRELPVESFALVESPCRTIVLKRAWHSHQRIAAIPPDIRILHIVRHPFDVLTSHNPMTGARFHVSPERWRAELGALRALIESDDPRLMVVRYEDLVSDTQAVLVRIAEAYGLVAKASSDEVMERANLPQEALAAMHGRRPVDSHSLGRFRNDPVALAHLRTILPELGETLDWVASRFGYDLALP